MYKYEYIWLDGYKPEPNLRSKTKILKVLTPLNDIPMWSFDGSSTKQATGDKSDCLLKPVRVIPDPARTNAFLVMCEVLNPDKTPHPTNTRSKYEDDEEFWFGFEQEYTLVNPDTGRPAGFPHNGFPASQGMYYCAVGSGNVECRNIIEQHLNLCLDAGLDITGINFEVMLGQAEYQILGKGAKRASDDLWLSRYILYRLTEEYGYKISLHPKPVRTENFNGSGCHCNFSNRRMREIGGQSYMESICEAMGKRHDETIKRYGSDNELRLTGEFETQSIDRFSYGVSDRSASIRIPISIPMDGWKGYLEDRRPSSNCDPYRVTRAIVDIVNTVE